MFTRTLGRSGIEVSAMGLGCWAIGGFIQGGDGKAAHWGEVNDDESIRAIHAALEMGVTFIDTADVYGRSEEILAKALVGRRDQVVLATKWGNVMDRSTYTFTGQDISPAYMRQALEASLKRLNTDYIDLYQFHLNGWQPAEDCAPLVDALEEQVKAGKIRAYAWSTDFIDGARIFERGPHNAAVQMNFNVFEGNDELLAFCEEKNLASINRGPLGMGFLTGKFSADSVLPKDDVRGAGHEWMQLFEDGRPNAELLQKLEAVREVLTSNGRTLAQGALAWLWGRSPMTVPIPGFKTVKQATENAAAMDFGPLTPAQMAEINTILGRPQPESA